MPTNIVGGIAGVLVGLVGRIFLAISPVLREFLRGMIDELEKKAASTPSEVDDIFVDFLKKLLGFED